MLEENIIIIIIQFIYQIFERQKKERKSINRKKKIFEKERKEDEDYGLGEEYNCRQMDGFVLLMVYGINQISNRNR